MNKTKLFFTISLIGVAFLLILAQINKPSIILKITNKNIGEFVFLEGKIKNIDYNAKTISLYIENYETKIVIFANQDINLSKGDKIEVYGKVDSYKNNLQIISDKIIKK